jgi:hypothetical protein
VRAAAILARAAACALLVAAGAGCGASTIRVASLDDLERVRAGAEVRDAAAQAPDAIARAERERDAARADHARGDDVGANLHAERAMAAYGHARAMQRLAVAVADLADSQKAIDDATAEEQALATSRTKLELEAQDLERQARVARDKLSPSHPETPADRQARWNTARTFAVEARLLCGAARLVAADIAGLTDAQSGVDALDAKLVEPSKAPASAAPSDATAARARCLEVLTRARRAGSRGEDGADALLAELSASGGWDPTRDERGIIVTLRGAFAGVKLTDEGAAALRKLGRVAAAHPSVGVQVVVHDALAPAASDDADAQRADAASKAVVEGGAAAARVKTERAGARAPLVDPSDARVRARNERLEVVFVSGA